MILLFVAGEAQNHPPSCTVDRQAGTGASSLSLAVGANKEETSGPRQGKRRDELGTVACLQQQREPLSRAVSRQRRSFAPPQPAAIPAAWAHRPNAEADVTMWLPLNEVFGLWKRRELGQLLFPGFLVTACDRSLGVERFSSWAGLEVLGPRSSFSLPRWLKLDQTLRRLRLTSNSDRKKWNDSCFVQLVILLIRRHTLSAGAPRAFFPPGEKGSLVLS